jgi:hypothetical protein
MQVLRNNLFKPWFTGSEDWGVEIIDGEYSGVIVQIESLNFSERNDGSVNLDFHIVNKDNYPDLETNSELFNSTIELIINDILREAIDHTNQTRSNDSTESS